MRLTGNFPVITPRKAKRTTSGKALFVRFRRSSAFATNIFDLTALGRDNGNITGGIQDTYGTYHNYTVCHYDVNHSCIHLALDRLETGRVNMAGGWECGPNGQQNEYHRSLWHRTLPGYSFQDAVIVRESFIIITGLD